MMLSRFRSCATAVALLLSSSICRSAEDWVFFGTYPSESGGSKGIYRSKFDAKTGQLTMPELAAEAASPSFLAIHPSGKFLYAVSEVPDGAIIAYSLDGKTGALTKLDEVKTGGADPCHVSIDPKGEYAVAANYTGGSTAVFKLQPDGKFGARIGFCQHKEEGKQPHAHCAFFDRTSHYFMSVDLGLDRIKFFAIDPAKGLEERTAADAVTPTGTGPRHIAIAADGKYAYFCGELNSTANVLKLQGIGSKNVVVQSLSTLPAPVKGNSTAECILSPNEKYLYVSNRGHNSIAAFKVGEDRKLTAAGYIAGDIKVPRNFNIDPSGKWMLIASQNGDKVGVWELDEKTGLGKETEVSVKIGKPVCIKFLPIAK